MIRALNSFINLKYSVFSFLFLGSFVFCLLLSNRESLDIFSFFFLKRLFLGIPTLFFARLFGIIINQIIDCSLDKNNPRTCLRVLPTKKISMYTAIIVAFICSFIFLFLSYFISFICFIEALLASLIIVIYPYMKRFHISCHFILGLIYSFAVIMVRGAFLQDINFSCILYAILVGLFISSNDILYSLLDKEFDKKQGLFSFPAILGEKFSIVTVYLCYGVSLLCLLLIGLLSQFSLLYYLLLMFFTLELFYLCIKLKRTLKSSIKGFSSWERAFFFSNILISLSLFSLFIILFVVT